MKTRARHACRTGALVASAVAAFFSPTLLADPDPEIQKTVDSPTFTAALELGPLGTFARLPGAAVSTPGNNDIFVFDPTPTNDATNATDVLLESGSRLFATGSNQELTSAALQPGTTGENVKGPRALHSFCKRSLPARSPDRRLNQRTHCAPWERTSARASSAVTEVGSDRASRCWARRDRSPARTGSRCRRPTTRWLPRCPTRSQLPLHRPLP